MAELQQGKPQAERGSSAKFAFVLAVSRWEGWGEQEGLPCC